MLLSTIFLKVCWNLPRILNFDLFFPDFLGSLWDPAISGIFQREQQASTRRQGLLFNCSPDLVRIFFEKKSAFLKARNLIKNQLYKFSLKNHFKIIPYRLPRNLLLYYFKNIFISSATVHADRRRYLRSALKELVLLMKDQPGLLGPKILFVWMALSYSRDEVGYFSKRLKRDSFLKNHMVHSLFETYHFTVLCWIWSISDFL